MNRNELEQLIYDKYGILSENIFEKYPSIGVFRHEENGKWFAVIMRVSSSKFGLCDEREINIVNLKFTEEVRDIVRSHLGIFPAYHMSKRHWISVFLDGSVEKETVEKLLEVSFEATI